MRITAIRLDRVVAPLDPPFPEAAAVARLRV
jgi:hypothetical protein